MVTDEMTSWQNDLAPISLMIPNEKPERKREREKESFRKFSAFQRERERKVGKNKVFEVYLIRYNT
jgi:hypothetical protein